MDKQTELAIVRRAYAKQIMAAVGIVDPRLQAAYAEVRREDFVGPGPWQVLRMTGGYRETPDADPVLLYMDQLIALVFPRRVLATPRRRWRWKPLSPREGGTRLPA